MFPDDIDADWLRKFHGEFIRHQKEFQQHLADAEKERRQQQEIHDALFRKENVDENDGPGIIQLMGRINQQLLEMRITYDRQKTFIGGVIFTCSAAWLFLGDVAKMLSSLKGLVK